jgi:hypothetical protein
MTSRQRMRRAAAYRACAHWSRTPGLYWFRGRLVFLSTLLESI